LEFFLDGYGAGDRSGAVGQTIGFRRLPRAVAL
jgi:hypothetical protein